MSLDLKNDLTVKKIIAIAKNKNIFIELKGEFENFFSHPPKDFNIALKELETIRRLLANKNFVFTIASMYSLENSLKKLPRSKVSYEEDFFKLIQDAQAPQVFANELSEILDILGDDFLKITDNITIEASLINDIEMQLQEILNEVTDSTKDKLIGVLQEVQKMKLSSFYDLIISYSEHINQIATHFNKKMKPLEIICDKDIVVPPTFKAFSKSLMHVFTNAIEHGIEIPRQRMHKGKDPRGLLTCHVTKNSNILSIEISDDGAGIDIDAICKDVLQKGIKTQEELDMLFDDDKMALIFEDIGMGTIKEFVEELGGSINIDSTQGQGTKIVFTIPINYGLHKFKDENDQVLSNVILQTQAFIEESTDIEFYTNKTVDIFETRDDNCYIKTDNEFKSTIAFSIDRRLIDKMCSVMFSGIPKEDQENLKDELINEITNTVIGLAIQNFPDDIKNTSISIPYSFDEKSIQALIESSDEYIIKNIYTSDGKISCMLLKD